MSTRERKNPLAIEHGRFRVGIVQAQFNSDLTHAQVTAAQECAKEYGVQTDVFLVAGAFEIPQVLDRLARSGSYDALVGIGCLIKGSTTHFEVISSAVSSGMMQVSLTWHMPVGFGVITALTREQAEERTWIGYDAMYAVLQSLSQNIAV